MKKNKNKNNVNNSNSSNIKKRERETERHTQIYIDINVEMPEFYSQSGKDNVPKITFMLTFSFLFTQVFSYHVKYSFKLNTSSAVICFCTVQRNGKCLLKH